MLRFKSQKCSPFSRELLYFLSTPEIKVDIGGKYAFNSQQIEAESKC